MSNAFSRISLVIDFAGDSFPADTLVLRHPAKHEPARSRIVMHETLHWWQQLGHGFMTKLAAEDWQRLLAFEETGVVPPTGPFKREFVRKDDALGFSANLLNEALTRYWDIHICGPLELLELERDERRWTDENFWHRYEGLQRHHRLTALDGTGYSDHAFTLAMEGAGGRYAQPYRLVIEQTSQKVAGIVFPIAAHFAFQTSRPTHYFAAFVQMLAPLAMHLPVADVETLWIEFYPVARKHIFPIILQNNEQPLFPIVEIRESGLDDHPGYMRALSEMEYWASQQLQNSNPGKEISRRLPRLDQKSVGLLALDIFLTTPGIPEHRSALYTMFPPPVVRFSDGQTWLLGEVHRKELHPDWTDEERAGPRLRQSAADAIEIDRRWARLLGARFQQ